MMNLQSMLLNVAEEYAKSRVRLDRHKRMEEGSEPTLWLGSFHEAFTQFKAAGVGADDLQATLNNLKYLPVFTAHPTVRASPPTLLFRSVLRQWVIS